MSLFKSKKFWTAIAGVFAVIMAHFFNVPEGTTLEIAGIVIALLVGQAAADFGKESKKVELGK